MTLVPLVLYSFVSSCYFVFPPGGEIDSVDKYGNTPLHVAAKYGHELLISTLMTNGADTARQGIHGMFPLHLAVLYGFSDCCRKLLSSGWYFLYILYHSFTHTSVGFYTLEGLSLTVVSRVGCYF